MESVDTTNSEEQSKRSPFDDLSRDDLVKKCKGLLAIAQKAKLAKTDLEEEVESYKLKLEKCETEKISSQENIKTLTELVESLTKQKLNFTTEIDEVKNKNRSLSSSYKTLEDELANCKANLLVKEKQITEQSIQLCGLDSENTSLKRQNNRLADENEQLITQMTELEAQIAEFNKIGLEQREQLQMLEKTVTAEDNNESSVLIDELKSKLLQLQSELQGKEDADAEYQKKHEAYEDKINKLNQLYECEKESNEKANTKMRSYREKILKCAACINQLKNSRYILTKTVQEYSESIPKWQKEIVKASEFLDKQLTEMSNENNSLKNKLKELEKKINDFTVPQDDKESLITSLQENIMKLQKSNELLENELQDLKPKYDQIVNNEMPSMYEKYDTLKNEFEDLIQSLNSLKLDNNELKSKVDVLKSKNNKLSEESKKFTEMSVNNKNIDSLNMQIKALESEKATLLKEKLNAKDSVLELDRQNKILNDQIAELQNDLQSLNNQWSALKEIKESLEKRVGKEMEADLTETKKLKSDLMQMQEQVKLLQKEHDTLLDINGLLKEEVETLKLSLDQPKDADTSDLTVSLQADLAKLQNKLSNCKQENASLLAEVKESRSKMKEVDLIISDYEDCKTKLSSYKSENTELLNEMKEINQVLKERGENISKLQKAISEMERLVETLEKDRDNANQERDSLLKKVAVMENDLRNAEQRTNDNKQATDLVVEERDSAVKALAEKDTIITTLKDEIENLKQHQSSGNDLPNEDMSTSTISKAEDHSRMKDLDDSFEYKYTKLRIFALKLKKKLNETTGQLQEAEQDKAKLEKMLNDKNNAGQDCVDGGNSDTHSSQICELEGKVASLNDALQASEKQLSEVERLKAELATISQQLASEVEAHKATKEYLERARKDVKKKSVLSLEMEDYERSMKELSNKMEDNKKKMIQMESTIDTQEGTITAMKTQIKQLEEQIKNEETQNRLTKEDLHRAIENAREKDNTIRNKNETINKLEQDLEDEKRRNEDANMEMTSLLSEKEKMIMSLGEEKVELNSRLKRIEFNCADLKENLKITNIELEDLKTEYSSYKVRAQAVLRQNQTVDHSQEELLKEETAALKTQIEANNAKLNTLQDECTSLRSAADVERRRASEAAGEAARAGQRTARLQADLARLAQQLDSERAQHKLQISTLTQCYKTQLADLEAKLTKETEDLKKQLASAKEQINTATALDKVNRNKVFLPIIPKDESDGEMDINVSMLPREEGEGSEAAPSPPLSKSFVTAGGNRSPVPLERLLEEGVPDDEALAVDAGALALAPEQEVADLRRKLQAQQQRVKHVTVLLSESERECARLSQLAELLKAEVRRACGSLERTGHAHNAEYLKNVTVKFLTLPPGDERSRLVPVLQKILTLSPAETHQINAVAKGLDPNPSKGWGSYLPWPGGK